VGSSSVSVAASVTWSKAEAGIDPLEPPLEEAHEVQGVTRGAGSRGVDKGHLAVAAEDRERDLPRAESPGSPA
jgi:hypothetical protein